MIVAIIAGGSGTRLWPLSTPDYPKHLLKIDGSDLSLLQSTYARAKKLGNEIYVVSDKSHAHHVQDQLPDLDEAHFLIEPARRGTASCIVALLARIKLQGLPEDEPIAILSADHYIRDIAGFKRSFKLAGQTAKKTSRLVLVGVEPDHPETGFGYIKKGELFDENQFIFTVDEFKEKPDYRTAQRYLQSGEYLWNCGYFVATLNGFEATMQADAPDLFHDYQQLVLEHDDYEQSYLNLTNNAIDYALIEKAKSLLVVPASFDWMDLGSFGDMHKAVASNELGNYVRGDKVELEQVSNSFIQNSEDKPIAVIGLDNVVIINTPHGILIARKDLSQKVGEISKRLNA
jgi:mannose-1-phosphate guanylyltransferase